MNLSQKINLILRYKDLNLMMSLLEMEKLLESIHNETILYMLYPPKLTQINLTAAPMRTI